MTGFEPRISGIGSDHSANWATTTALFLHKFRICNLTTNFVNKFLAVNNEEKSLIK